MCLCQQDKRAKKKLKEAAPSASAAEKTDGVNGGDTDKAEDLGIDQFSGV